MAWRASRVPYAAVAALQAALGCAEPVAWTLVRRGLGDPEAAREFLASDGPLEPPEALAGVTAAADRLARATTAGEPIVVHGDYDCDGITSTAILVRALTARGARVRAFLPSRFTDGYGVSEATVERLAGEGARLVCCVDCGTTAVGPLARAAELGMDTIVLDHHLAGGVRPPGILVNPALGRGTDALPAAAGVVFRVVRALAARMDGARPARPHRAAESPRGGGRVLWRDGLDLRLAPAPEDGIDLVALATVADAVPLIGENRRLVARGLAAIHAAPRPGIAALCRVAGIDPRAVTARALAFQLAPSLNAAGRLAHPERALELLLAPDADTAEPIARELWQLNLERREIEQSITAEAIAQVEASPPAERDAPALLVAGDGWHEGVVGIVASRLTERFERPAIVLARDGERAKGSGRSVGGVDLHALVGGAAGALTRWGGHAGAVGLELPAAAIAGFRAALAQAAEGFRAAIARSRVRRVDAVVAGGDLRLGTAEALETLAPFGRGNPAVRLLLPAARLEGPGTVGADRRHLSLRLHAGGAHTRAVGWGMGERAAALDVERRHDAVVGLQVDRWQGLVSPKVVVEALEPVEAPARLAPGLCPQRCDAACPERVGDADLWSRLRAPEPARALPEGVAGPPLGVRDRRGEGAALALLAALAGTDGGVVAVVADVALRREALAIALEPLRLGVEVAALGGSRCGLGPLHARMGLARSAPSLVMLDYARLADVDPPPQSHLVVVDPPAGPDDARWLEHRAEGRWLHLAYGPAEVALAVQVAEAEWELRPAVTAVYRALRDAGPRRDAAALAAALLGAGPIMSRPEPALRALRVLAELGLVAIAPDAVAVVPDAPRRELSESATYRAAQERLADARAYLDRAASLVLGGHAMEAVPEADLALAAPG